ncbi:MAG: hypothetical protein C0469_02320 [Cyanobacteria bacterium DS2.3.42]|nr:hypothetical protein [Cyanobacteria bacterium DS2.3.42]
MVQDPKSSPTISAKVWFVVIAILAVLGTLVWFGAHAWLHYAQNTLLWDEHKVETVTYSAMAIPFAALVWFGLSRINKLPESVPAEQRKMQMLNLVVQPFGWSLLFLAYALSEMREQWHVAREIYFFIATASSALLFFTHLVQLKMTREKLQIISVFAWLILFCILLYKFFWGPTSKGLLG